jgi:hypothetical protein
VADVIASVREPSPDLPQIRSEEAASNLLNRIEKSVDRELGEQSLRDLILSTRPESA